MGNNPGEGETVTLLVGFDGAKSDITARIQELGGIVTEELPFDTLKIEISSMKIDELRDIGTIESIERDEEGRIQGNSSSPQATNR